MSDTVTLPNAARPTLGKKRPRLYVLHTPQQGIVRGCAHSLLVGETYIGRLLSRDHEGITLAGDPSLSMEHAHVDVTDGDHQVKLRDLGSKNGTWVGATRLRHGESAVVCDGDVVRLGGTFLVVRYESSKSGDAEIPTLVGVSLPMRELRARLQRLAQERAPVLLMGETGTGKELAARALHLLSKRTGELVIRNCAALPETLIESELFGHATHSFTGAKPRLGAFRTADQGTLFLDEIGELPATQQARLLRVIEEDCVTPIGADKPVPCQVRLVTATNRDLQAAVDAGHFRQDLRARLAHLVVELPPLRARREDLLLLLAHFYPDVGPLLSADLVHDLLLSAWRDNVRALRAIADRLRIDGDTEGLRESLRPRLAPRVEVSSALAPLPAAPEPPRAAPLHTAPVHASSVSPPARPYRLPAPSREQLVTLLTRHLGTVVHVAKELGCSRRQVQRWLDQYGLDADSYRTKPV